MDSFTAAIEILFQHMRVTYTLMMLCYGLMVIAAVGIIVILVLAAINISGPEADRAEE